jgi:hypothetical protein
MGPGPPPGHFGQENFKNWSGGYLNLKLIFESSSAQTWGSMGLQKHGFRVVVVLLKTRLRLISGFNDFWEMSCLQI